MNLYAFEFREKGSKDSRTALILAEDTEQAREKFWKHPDIERGIYDVDRRTVKWGGDSIPLMNSNSHRLTVLNQSLEG